MKTPALADPNPPEVQSTRCLRLVAILDAVLLGLFPMFFAMLGFLANLPRAFSPPVQVIRVIGWYAPLEWYIMSGRPVSSQIDFFIGHGLASLAPGFVVLVASIWAWRGGAKSRNVLIDLVVIVNLLSALAVLTIRSFGPFPSWLIISRWLLAGILIALNNGIENDPRRALRNFARSALHLFGIEHSALEEPAKINPVIDNGARDKADPVEMRDLALFRIIRGFYILAFFPAFFCATQAGYIFDGGETPENQRLYWVLVSFPITILISIASSRMFHRANKFNATILMLFLPLIHFIMLLLLD